MRPFQHTAARRRLGLHKVKGIYPAIVSTHSRPKAAGLRNVFSISTLIVSTHSRPKAAGLIQEFFLLISKKFQHTAARRRLGVSMRPFRGRICFNTQPPEGGWARCTALPPRSSSFQHTAARRRLDLICRGLTDSPLFQHTAARRRLAISNGFFAFKNNGFQHTAARRRLVRRGWRCSGVKGSFNTQPPEGGWGAVGAMIKDVMCFNTQPPEGGWLSRVKPYPLCGGFNTQPPEGGWISTVPRLRRRRCFNTQPPEGGWHPPQPRSRTMTAMFQHTAARRRLVLDAVGHGFACVVSTHSRPKAAGTTKQSETTPTCRFNTQPPEGGWRAAVMMRLGDAVSTHSRPKAAGPI